MIRSLEKLGFPLAAPSLLSANRSDLPNEVRRAERLGAHIIHLDIMDGRFVPNVSFSVEESKTIISSASKALVDTHIMVSDVLKEARLYCSLGSDIVTFHLEACESEAAAREAIAAIKGYGRVPGISIKPATPAEAVRPYINDAGLILVMSVEPGRGGQKFMPESLDKVHAIKEMTAPMGEGRRPLIEIDGGINAETGRAAAEAGADILVAGSYIFGHDDMAARLESLQGEKR